MSSKLSNLMQEHRLELRDRVVERVSRSRAIHYREMNRDRLRERADQLVDAFIDAMTVGPGVFVRYLVDIIEVRIREGFFLQEIQLALSMLEEKAWQVVVDHDTSDDKIESLARVSTTIGSAKDRIAQIYIVHLTDAEPDGTSVMGGAWTKRHGDSARSSGTAR